MISFEAYHKYGSYISRINPNLFMAGFYSCKDKHEFPTSLEPSSNFSQMTLNFYSIQDESRTYPNAEARYTAKILGMAGFYLEDSQPRFRMRLKPRQLSPE